MRGIEIHSVDRSFIPTLAPGSVLRPWGERCFQGKSLERRLAVVKPSWLWRGRLGRSRVNFAVSRHRPLPVIGHVASPGSMGHGAGLPPRLRQKCHRSDIPPGISPWF